MRAGIEITVTPEDRGRLEAIARNRNAKLKHVAGAKVILATADGCGTMEITRRSGLSRPALWRWQERFMHEGVNALLRDKTRPPGKPRLPDETVSIFPGSGERLLAIAHAVGAMAFLLVWVLGPLILLALYALKAVVH